ncbi:hypothetical protein GLOIN_2v1482640 [Rhizophagus irregularis DAOM 181602=DAOM 197198]|nr:hypothetical protein GLOIN_2v1482640 [Rhizophagus irregularis DAOM 181602=DAOM 197198]
MVVSSDFLTNITNKRKLYVLNLSVYKFSIPWFIQTSKAWKKRNLAVESGDSSQDTPTSSSSNPITPTISLPAMEKNLPTVGSYGPYNFDIPTDLLPYVPPGHLYVNKKAKRSKIIPPGSPEWIDKIKVIQQEYETYYELLKIAEDQKAKFLGTSSKHLHKRKGLVSDLTKYTDTFDRKFTSLLNRRACCTKQKAIMQANEDFKTFQPDYFEINTTPDKGNTSDETTTLELRPNKRNTILYFPGYKALLSYLEKYEEPTYQNFLYLKRDVLINSPHLLEKRVRSRSTNYQNNKI